MTARDRQDSDQTGAGRRRRWGRGDRDERGAGGEDEFGWLAELRNAKIGRAHV